MGVFAQDNRAYKILQIIVAFVIFFSYNCVFGTMIKDIRKQKGLTTIQVAAELGISQGYYSQLENGRRTFDNGQLAKLAGILQVDAAFLRSSAIRVEEDNRLLHHWLTSTPINGIPALQAFRKHYQGKRFKNAVEVRRAFSIFVKKNIVKEIDAELNSNNELVHLMLASINKK